MALIRTICSSRIRIPNIPTKWLNKHYCSSTNIDQSRIKGPMLQKQGDLGRLPVPPLQETLSKYLRSVKPLLSDEDFKQTLNTAKNYGAPGGIGEKLHSLLVKKAQDCENWLYDWWLKCAYLEFREPLVANSNPGLVFPLQDFVNTEDQLKYAARLICAALDFKLMVDNEELEPEMAGPSPLDMSQYKKIFSACRIPLKNCDTWINYDDTRIPPRHIIVISNNNFFEVDVFGEDGCPLNESQVLSQLITVMEHSQHRKDPVGVLTTEHRDIWAKAYKRLYKSSKINEATIKSIQQGIFVLCLDKAPPLIESNAKNITTRAGLLSLHGMGTVANAGNRWYDKTVQFMVSEDGLVGLCYEHTPAEGPPIISVMNHIVNYIDKTSGNSWLPAVNAKPPKKLKFELTDETLTDINQADQDLNSLIDDLDLHCFTFEGYGKEFVKSQKQSPDSFVQMAIQLAYYRMHKDIAATYESASTRKFLHGRTETIRSTSVESKEFCENMLSNAPTNVKVDYLKKAINSHKKYTVDAGNGLGVDRVLLGLKKIAIEEGLNVPDFYMDPGYTKSTHFIISTSQVPSKYDAVMCYGPLVPNGYGCCYNPRANTINFGVSAYNSNPETNASDFKKALEESLTQMHDVLMMAQSSKL